MGGVKSLGVGGSAGGGGWGYQLGGGKGVSGDPFTQAFYIFFEH